MAKENAVRASPPRVLTSMALVVERKILTGNQIRDYQDANGNRITGAPRTFDASKIIFESTNATVTFGANSIFRGGDDNPA